MSQSNNQDSLAQEGIDWGSLSLEERRDLLALSMFERITEGFDSVSGKNTASPSGGDLTEEELYALDAIDAYESFVSDVDESDDDDR